LTDGQELNTDNQNWNVRLVWRNKDPTYASKSADALRKIIIYDAHAPMTSDELLSGDTYNVITDPVAYQLEFGGITLGASDYDSLALTYSYYPTPTFAVQTNYDAQCTGTGSTVGYLAGNFLQVQSNVKDAFQISGNGDTYQVQRFYIYSGNGTDSTSGLTLDNGSMVTSDNSADWGIPLPVDGDVLFQKPVGSCYYILNPSYHGVQVSDTSNIQYMAGDATSDDWGVLYNTTGTYMTGDTAVQQGYMQFQEAASSNAGISDYWVIPIYADTDYKNKFLLTSTTTKEIYYQGVTGDTNVDPAMAIGYTTAEPGYYSERGSQLAGIDTYSVEINRAERLGELQFFVKSQGANTTTATTVGPLGVNDTANVGNGVTLLVDSITQTVGTCTAGPNAQCTVTGQSGLTATPSVTSADVRVALDPSQAPLVVLDSNADTSATLIAVGGPAVNTVTAAAMQGSSLTLANPGDYIAQPVGDNRILVAGYTAADTTTAANKFITDLIAAAGQ
jgi:hypothetical protein